MEVGEGVGTGVGLGEGDTVGAGEGIAEGIAVGTGLGLGVGKGVGHASVLHSAPSTSGLQTKPPCAIGKLTDRSLECCPVPHV